MISNLNSGANGTGFYRGTGAWSQSNLVQRPSWRVQCTSPQVNVSPAMGVLGSPQLGASYSPTVAGALANTVAVLVSGLSDATSGGLPLPLALPGAPGCEQLVSSDYLLLQVTDAQGAAQQPVAVPNASALTGLAVYHQWFVWDPTVNALNFVVSDAGVATVGN